MRLRGSDRPVRSRRRSGPVGEQVWWDPADQALAQGLIVTSRELGRGWSRAAMVNNEERLDPYGDDVHSEAIRAARGEGILTALDEGAAWRRRKGGSLVVARVEVFASDDQHAYRRAWAEHGAACLDALWRQRWLERDRQPGWIEARWRSAAERPATLSAPDGIDWLTIEDQTGSAETEVVTMYEHLSVWSGRGLVTLTVRHRQQENLDDVAVAAVNAVGRRLAQWSR